MYIYLYVVLCNMMQHRGDGEPFGEMHPKGDPVDYATSGK